MTSVLASDDKIGFSPVRMYLLVIGNSIINNLEGSHLSVIVRCDLSRARSVLF